jgi:hypothetical protein
VTGASPRRSAAEAIAEFEGINFAVHVGGAAGGSDAIPAVPAVPRLLQEAVRAPP